MTRFLFRFAPFTVIAMMGPAVLGRLASPPVAGQVEQRRDMTTAQTIVELITATSTVPPAGGDLWLGIRFRLQDQWHIYWQNPGDSGGPPTVKWQLPDGVTADDIQWPMPKRIPIGPLVNYGYEGDVILPVRLHVSPSAVRRSTLPIRADLRWLVCRDICVSGKATLGLSLPLDAESRRESASWRTRIAASRAAVPLAAPGTWQASAVSTKNDFLLTVRMDRAAKTAAFFPLDESRIDDSAPQVVTSDGTVLHIRLRKSDHLVGDPSVLRGVLAIVSGPTAVITAPIDAVGAPQTSSGSQQ